MTRLGAIARASLLAAAAGAAAPSCGGPRGTIQLSIVTAPESAIMDEVARVRLALSDPPATQEAERGDDGGFDLALDVEAGGERGRLTLEGFDDEGELIAAGHAGPLPVASIDAEIAIYVAEPHSIDEAPAELEPARAELGAAALSFGAALFGGRGPQGEISDEAAVYNAHSHDFQRGASLPEPRAAPAVTARGPDGPVYIFGGEGEDGAPANTAWQFDTATPPEGVYSEIALEGELARAGAAAAPLGGGGALVAGDPPVAIDAVSLTASPIAGASAHSGTATAGRDGGGPVVFVTGDAGDGEDGAARWSASGFEALEAPDALARTAHIDADLPGGDVLVAGGEAAGEVLGSAVRYSPEGDDFEVLGSLLSTPRADAAAARSRGVVLIAGGRGEDGGILGEAELFDAETLEPLGELPLGVPREGAAAVPLANGQILIAGGRGESGEPVAELELYTPAPFQGRENPMRRTPDLAPYSASQLQ